MNFKFWLENTVAQYVKPNTLVYRGLRLGPQSRKFTFRQLLTQDYFNRQSRGTGRSFDHWSLEFDTAQRFAKSGGYLNPDGTSGGDGIVRIVIEAQIGPQDVDEREFERILKGSDYSHLNGGSYFNTSSQKVQGQEQEIPVLKTSYSTIKFTRYWIEKNGSWELGTSTQALI